MDIAMKGAVSPVESAVSKSRFFIVVIFWMTLVALSWNARPVMADPPPDDFPPSQQLVSAMSELPAGYAVPLYPLGDVDENGRVDVVDRQLIHAMAQTETTKWSSIPAVSCPGAADLNIDGVVDDLDGDLADELLADAPMGAPALFFQAALKCRFERLTVASELFLLSGEENPVYLLREGANVENTSFSVESGPGSVTTGEDDRTFFIGVDAAAATGDTVVVEIRFAGDEVYILSLPVQAPSDIQLGS